MLCEKKRIYFKFKPVTCSSFLEMAKNHSLMHTIFDSVDLNPPSVTFFPEYLVFSHMEAFYVPSYLCGLSVWGFFSDLLYSFINRVTRTTHLIRCQDTTRVT